jgi:hypothetical protein
LTPRYPRIFTQKAIFSWVVPPKIKLYHPEDSSFNSLIKYDKHSNGSRPSKSPLDPGQQHQLFWNCRSLTRSFDPLLPNLAARVPGAQQWENHWIHYIPIRENAYSHLFWTMLTDKRAILYIN